MDPRGLDPTSSRVAPGWSGVFLLRDTLPIISGTPRAEVGVVTDNLEVTPEPVVETPAAQETPPATDTPPAKPQEPDYKAQLGQAEAKYEARLAEIERQARQREKQLEGRIRKAEEETRARQAAFFKGEIQNEEQAQAWDNSRRKQSFHDGADAEANRVFGEAEKLGVDPLTDESLAEARDYLAEADEALTPAMYNRAINAAKRSADRVLNELRAKKQAEKVPEPAPKERDPELRDRTRALERGRGLPEASGGGSGFSRYEDLVDAHITGRISPEEYIRIAHSRFGVSV